MRTVKRIRDQDGVTEVKLLYSASTFLVPKTPRQEKPSSILASPYLYLNLLDHIILEFWANL